MDVMTSSPKRYDKDGVEIDHQVAACLSLICDDCQHLDLILQVEMMILKLTMNNNDDTEILPSGAARDQKMSMRMTMKKES